MNREYFNLALSSKLNLAIPLENMGAVIQIKTTDICIVPGVAEFWHGVVNFKGSLLWVLDTNRYFNLPETSVNFSKKITAVIIKQQQNSDSNKLALITSKLKGIISLSSEELKPISEKKSWGDCCSATFENEIESTFILNTNDLLKQLKERSELITA